LRIGAEKWRSSPPLRQLRGPASGTCGGPAAAQGQHQAAACSTRASPDRPDFAYHASDYGWGVYGLHLFTVAFDRAIAGNGIVLGALIVLWGAAGTLNLLSGRLIDVIGGRKVIFLLLAIQSVNTVLFPWTSANLLTAAVAIAIWGACGWGYLAPQQHRLVTVAPQAAAVLLGMNNSFSYLGLSLGGVVGAVGIHLVDAHRLGFIGRFCSRARLKTHQRSPHGKARLGDSIGLIKGVSRPLHFERDIRANKRVTTKRGWMRTAKQSVHSAKGLDGRSSFQSIWDSNLDGASRLSTAVRTTRCTGC
jgi:hypothetical protein